MKYKLTKNKKTIGEITLYQIEALKDFSDIKKGYLGGWIEKESNLSQQGDCWVTGDAIVSGNAWVSGSAWVCDNAIVSGNAWVSGSAWVFGNAQVSGDAIIT
jgi:NDP-sugar pyrophosphorylase family protein